MDGWMYGLDWTGMDCINWITKRDTEREKEKERERERKKQGEESRPCIARCPCAIRINTPWFKERE
jgi:hypothetical protein